MPEILKCVPSYGRADNVPAMEELICPDVWFVNSDEEADEYRSAGAGNVEATGCSSLLETRNYILEYCKQVGMWCATFDDDIVRVAELVGEFTLVDIDIADVIDAVVNAILANEVHLGGAFPYEIVKWMRPTISKRVMVSAGFMVIDTDSTVQWSDDPDMTYKDDEDFCMSHITKYGGLVRLNNYLVANRMAWKEIHNRPKVRTKGGLASSRTIDNEVRSAVTLMNKWPGVFKKGEYPGETKLARRL